jgi:hypothetical protein
MLAPMTSASETVPIPAGPQEALAGLGLTTDHAAGG